MRSLEYLDSLLRDGRVLAGRQLLQKAKARLKGEDIRQKMLCRQVKAYLHLREYKETRHGKKNTSGEPRQDSRTAA
jgi:hypothetical protein